MNESKKRRVMEKAFSLENNKNRGMVMTSDNLVTSFMSKMQLKKEEEEIILSFIREYKEDNEPVKPSHYYAVSMPYGSTELQAVCMIELASEYDHAEIRNVAWKDQDIACVIDFISNIPLYLKGNWNIPIIISCSEKLGGILKHLKTTINTERVNIFEEKSSHKEYIEDTKIPWNSVWRHIFLYNIEIDNTMVVDHIE